MTQGLFDINRHGVLKAPLSLWLNAAFLLRHWVLLSILASLWLGPPGNVSWVYGILSWPMVLVESPMLLLVCAGVRRVPEGGAWASFLWRRGREIMTLTAAFGAAWAAWYLMGQDEWRPWPERAIAAMALIDVAIAIGCWRSEIYRAVFMEFPATPATLQSSE